MSLRLCGITLLSTLVEFIKSDLEWIADCYKFKKLVRFLLYLQQRIILKVPQYTML